MNPPAALVRYVTGQGAGQGSPAVAALVQAVRDRHGATVQAVVFYGSCLRAGSAADGLYDLYVLVDSYRAANRDRLRAVLNRLLPPNVFYLEVETGAGRVRAKYALLSLADLERTTSPATFHSSFWARFAQPVALVWARDEGAAARVHAASARAVCTFISRVAPLLAAGWKVEDLWLEGLRLTYRAEFRPERPDRQQQLFAAAPAWFEAVTALALPCLGLAPGLASAPVARRRARCAWRLRILQGKVLSVLRLAKATLTFTGGVDYILWKVERHSGVRLEVSPFLRRHPLLALCSLSLRLYRRGGVR
jgi:hypothetical protein